jgi:hypothetical protein
MTPLLHNYTKKAGRIFEWDTSDNQQAYLKNLTVPELKQKLIELGFVDCPIEYKFNSHGFRTEEFKNSIDAVCFGCSFTMGTGVHTIDTWPAQLAQLTGLKIANLGHAGSSNDTAFRFAEHYLKFLRPRYAIWLQTDMHRIELIDQANSVTLNLLASDNQNPCANDYYTKIWFSGDTNHRLNLEKNTRAFQHLCKELQIKSIILDRGQVPPHGLFPHSSARDLTHPGAHDYKQLASQIAGLLNTC